MGAILWIGAAMAVAGLVGVLLCIRQAIALRNEARGGADTSAAMRRLIAWNSASVGGAFLGLGVMVVGITLG